MKSNKNKVKEIKKSQNNSPRLTSVTTDMPNFLLCWPQALLGCLLIRKFLYPWRKSRSSCSIFAKNKYYWMHLLILKNNNYKLRNFVFILVHKLKCVDCVRAKLNIVACGWSHRKGFSNNNTSLIHQSSSANDFSRNNMQRSYHRLRAL